MKTVPFYRAGETESEKVSPITLDIIASSLQIREAVIENYKRAASQMSSKVQQTDDGKGN